MRRIVTFLVVIAAGTGVARAQNAPVSFVPFENTVNDLRALNPASGDRLKEISAIVTEQTREFTIFSLGREVYASLVEQARIDKQLGASASGPGSTSLVSRGSVPALIGIAVESGALYQSANGSGVTFRVNPAGLARALARGSFLASGPLLNSTALEGGLTRFSASATFDLQQGSSPGTFTGERSQVQEATVRYDAINKRDPRHPSHAAAIERLRAQLPNVVAVAQAYLNAVTTLPGYAQWREAAAKRLLAVNVANDTALRDALFAIGDEYTRQFASSAELRPLAEATVAEMKAFRRTRDAVFDAIEKSSVLTVEYAFNRLNVPAAALASIPAGTTVPDLSTARVIFASPLGGVGEATINGSVSLFNTELAGMDGAMRDVQVSGSLEFRLPEIDGVGRLMLSFAGLGAFLQQQPFGLPVRIQDIETTDGAIGVFQAKLTLPAAGSGVRIPISLTFANRSEFNTEGEVRGAVGLTFDFDQLFAR